MASKTFCPIMTIGFDPPEKGKRDNRLCMRDCTWYNVEQETCNLNVIAAAVEEIELHTNDIEENLLYGGYEDDSPASAYEAEKYHSPWTGK